MLLILLVVDKLIPLDNHKQDYTYNILYKYYKHWL